MPGIVGGIGCANSQYEKLLAAFSDIWDNCEVVKTPMGLIAGHAFAGLKALHVSREYHLAVDGEDALYRDGARQADRAWPDIFQLQNDELTLGPACKGNFALLDQHGDMLRLAADWSGAFPLYYVKSADGLLFSSHLRPLARAVDAKSDPVGVVEFMRYGYTLSTRTLFRGISRLLPGQVLTYSRSARKQQIRETSKVWTSRLDSTDAAELVELAWKYTNDAVVRCLDAGKRQAVMASAGWDSRLLLAAMRAHVGDDAIMGYTHGDPASRELEIVANIYGESGVTLHEEPLSARSYDVDLLRNGFDRVENIVFPYWHRAGAWLAEAGVQCVSAGVLGEIIGGHYGNTMLLSGWEKMLYVVSRLHSNKARPEKARQNFKRARELLCAERISRPWYLSREFWESAPDIADEVAADVGKEVKRIEARGVTDADQLVEAYITESRGSRYVTAQLLSCRAHVNVANIFGDQELMLFASTVPMPLKIHNSLSRLLLHEQAKELLRFPTAAILTSSNAPVIVQEASRILRRMCAGYSRRRFISSHSRSKLRCLGWDNFEFLRDGKVLSAIVAEFKSGLVDKKALSKLIGNLTTYSTTTDLHDVSNQFMKIYTTELMLGGERLA